jgi:hypothetical protein
MRTALTAFAATLMIAASPAIGEPCAKGDLCVVDAHGTQIGRLVGFNVVIRAYNGVFYGFDVDPQGVQETAWFLYLSADCTGTPRHISLPTMYYPRQPYSINTKYCRRHLGQLYKVTLPRILSGGVFSL